MSEPSTYELAGGIARVTLACPEKRNVLSFESNDALVGALNQATAFRERSSINWEEASAEAKA